MSIKHFTQLAQDFLNDLNNWPAEAKRAVQNKKGTVVFGENDTLISKDAGGWYGGGWHVLRSQRKEFPAPEVWGDAQVLKTDISIPDFLALQYFSPKAQAHLTYLANWPKGMDGVCQDTSGQVYFYRGTPPRSNDTYWTMSGVRGGHWIENATVNFLEDAPIDWAKAIIDKNALLQNLVKVSRGKLNFYPSCIQSFSDDAKAFINDQANWPNDAVMACQDADGYLKFSAHKEARYDGIWVREDSYRTQPCSPTPNSKTAIVLKADLFSNLTHAEECIKRFSDDAQPYISNKDNWPKQAVGAVQGPTGNVLFYSQGMKIEDTDSYWIRIPGDTFIGVKGIPKCVPPNWRKAKVLKTDLFGLQLGEPQSETSGKWVKATEASNLPTLIINGHWESFHFPINYKVGDNDEQFSLEFSGLKDRPISPQKMRELLMEAKNLCRIRSTWYHNDIINGDGAMCVAGQDYQWVPGCT